MDPFEIADLPLFAGCTPRQLHFVSHLVKGVIVPPGQVLMHQGQPGRECLIVCAGTVTISRDGVELRRAGRGDVIEPVAMLDSERAVATAVADDPVAVLVLTSERFERLAARLPLVSVRIYKEAMRQVARVLVEAPAPVESVRAPAVTG